MSNRIEHYVLKLERYIDDGHGHKVKEKAPIVFTTSRFIPDIMTTFPKEQDIRDISKYLCSKMEEYMDTLDDNWVEQDELDTADTLGMTFTIPDSFIGIKENNYGYDDTNDM